MTMKILYGAVVVTLLALGSTTTAQAFDLPDAFDEPCTGGMGILADICNAINDIHDFIHEQEIRTNSLNATQIVQQTQINAVNATQISELAEQNLIQVNATTARTNIGILQGNVTSLHNDKFDADRMGFTILTDTNNSSCETSPIPVFEWCPNTISLNQFNITDVAITEGSFVLTHTDKNPGRGACNVNNIEDGWFVVQCAQVPADGAELYYMLIE